MRHLLGGDYHSPGWESEAWSSPAREPNPAAGQSRESAASEGSPATPAVAAANGNGRLLQGSADMASIQGCIPAGDPASAQCPSIPTASAAMPTGGDLEDVLGSVATPEASPSGDAASTVAVVEEPAEHASAAGDASAGIEPSPQQAADGACTVITKQPLSAVPARLQRRAALATPGGGASPGAWALVCSPGSELDTPTAGEVAQPCIIYSQQVDTGWYCHGSEAALMSCCKQA